MEQFCKLCQQFEKSIVKEETKPKNEKKKEMEKHVEMHRLQLRLVNGLAISKSEMFKKCFPGVASDALVASKNDRQHQLPLLKFCDRFFACRRRDTTLQCKVCHRQCFWKNGYFNNNKVIEHVRAHMKGKFFKCRPCDFRASSISTMRRHLNQDHKLDGTNVNYEDLLCNANHIGEFEKMIERCFGQSATDSTDQPNIFEKDPQKYAFSNKCLEILANRDRTMPVPCFECGTKLKIFGQGNVNWNYAVNHACVHLKKFLFACRHCDTRYSSKSAMKLHLQKVHNLNTTPQNYIDLFDNHRDEVMNMMKRCFEQRQGGDPIEVKPTRVFAFRNYRAPLINFCRRLFANRDNGSRVECLACKRQLKCITKHGSANINLIMNHVYAHMKKRMFKCRQCDRRTLTKLSIGKHLRKVHKLEMKKAYYDDLSHKHLEEIKATIRRCFEVSEENGTVEMNSQKLNQLSLINFCRDLFENRNSVSPVKCRQCRLWVSCFRKNGTLQPRIAIDHACTHLKTALMTCRRCDYQTFTKRRIMKHLARVHKLGMSNDNYEDLSCNYHDEIKATMTRCFRK